MPRTEGAGIVVPLPAAADAAAVAAPLGRPAFLEIVDPAGHDRPSGAVVRASFNAPTTASPASVDGRAAVATPEPAVSATIASGTHLENV